jgi:hypothetical protein
MERLTVPTLPLRRSKRLALNVTADTMLTIAEINGTKLQPQQLASRRFPLEFLCEVAGAVMDQETGDMLEYRQLMKLPKYCDTWSKAFGKKLGGWCKARKESLKEQMPFSSCHTNKCLQKDRRTSRMQGYVPTIVQRRLIQIGSGSHSAGT